MVAPARRRRPQQEVRSRSAPRARSAVGDGAHDPHSNTHQDNGAHSDTSLFRVRLRGHAGGIRLPLVANRLSVSALRTAASPVGGEIIRLRSLAVVAAGSRLDQMATKKMASKKARVPVLPSSPSGGRAIHRAKDLLDDNQRQALRSDLDRLARIRREAEAKSASLRLS
jgi:hypothetical protein